MRTNHETNGCLTTQHRSDYRRNVWRLILKNTHFICHLLLLSFHSQVGLTGSQVWWATDVGIAFERVEEGFETALKDYNKKQVVSSLPISLVCDHGSVL